MVSEDLQKIFAFIIVFISYMAVPFSVLILGLSLLLFGINFLHFLGDPSMKHGLTVLYTVIFIILDLFLLRTLVRWLRK